VALSKSRSRKINLSPLIKKWDCLSTTTNEIFMCAILLALKLINSINYPINWNQILNVLYMCICLPSPKKWEKAKKFIEKTGEC